MKWSVPFSHFGHFGPLFGLMILLSRHGSIRSPHRRLGCAPTRGGGSFGDFQRSGVAHHHTITPAWVSAVSPPANGAGLVKAATAAQHGCRGWPWLHAFGMIANRLHEPIHRRLRSASHQITPNHTNSRVALHAASLTMPPSERHGTSAPRAARSAMCGDTARIPAHRAGASHCSRRAAAVARACSTLPSLLCGTRTGGSGRSPKGQAARSQAPPLPRALRRTPLAPAGRRTRPRADVPSPQQRQHAHASDCQHRQGDGELPGRA